MIYNETNKDFGKSASKYRVRSIVKSFRDLQVYQLTIQLSNELMFLEFLEEERQEMKNVSENIPKLIAEAYGDRFDSEDLAYKKLSEAVKFVSNIITKIDLLREKYKEEKEKKEILDKILTKYTYQRRKILNLRKAWSSNGK